MLFLFLLGTFEKFSLSIIDYLKLSVNLIFLVNDKKRHLISYVHRN